MSTFHKLANVAKSQIADVSESLSLRSSKNEKIRLDDREKREQEHTAAIILLFGLHWSTLTKRQLQRRSVSYAIDIGIFNLAIPTCLEFSPSRTISAKQSLIFPIVDFEDASFGVSP